MKHLKLITILLILALGAAGCGARDATGTIEEYLRAKVEDSDEAKLVNLSCAAWEAEARTDAASFGSIDAKIEGLACKEAGTEDGYTLVRCEGTINAVYNGENRALPVGGPYRALREDGEWKMCGLAEDAE